MPSNKHAPLLLALVLALDCPAPAQPKAPAPAAKTTPPASAPAYKATAERIRQWVRDMDDDRSKIRDQAVANLTRAGKAAVGPVAEAAKGSSLEVTFRAMTVLRSLLGSKDAPTQEAAKAALKKLADSGHQEAAGQASRILQAAEPSARRPVARRGGAVRIAGRANVAARAQPARKNPMANIALRLWVVEMGGTLNVTVVEKGSQIRIQETQSQITVTVIDKIAAQGKQKQYRAANAAELKKNHPAAHKLYEKYVGKGKGKALAAERLAAVRTAALIEAAQKELTGAVADLKAAQQAKVDAKRLGDLLKRIEAANKKLTEARKKLTE